MKKTKTIFKSFFKCTIIFVLIMAFSCISFRKNALADSFEDTKIKYFIASKTDIPYAGKTLLEWEVEGAVAVELLGLEKETEEMLPLAGSLEVVLTKTTTFTLVAEGILGEKVYQSITVNVEKKELKNAKIKSFTASATHIPFGGTVELKWEVEDAVSVELLGWEKASEEMLLLSGSLKVELIETTDFVLTAIGESGNEVCLSIKVYVDEEEQKPIITSFTASRENVERGTLVTLKWTTANAKECRLLTDDGIEVLDRPVNGQLSITPNRTMTYTLIAINGSYRDEKSIIIHVKK
jgi:hypothetical protein